MNLLLCKFCEYSTQLHSGRHSMIGMFENIVLPFFPFEHPPCFLCIQFEFDPDEAETNLDVEAVLIDEDGRSLMNLAASGTVPRDTQGGPTRLFIQFVVPPIRFERPGMYRVDILANGSKMGEERLPVLKGPPMPAQGQP